MQQAQEEAVLERVGEYAPETLSRWHTMVREEREALFRRNWKNRRQSVLLRSRDDEMAFQFILEWCDESGELLDRQKERNRLDELIALGLDVNAPENRPS